MSTVAIETIDYRCRPKAEQLIAKNGFIIKNFPTESNAALLEYAAELGSLSLDGIGSPTNRLEDSAIHLIEQREVPALDHFNNVMLSTTNLHFPLHTDEYFAERPARFVMLLCIDPGQAGGTALVSYITDIVPELSPPSRQVLQERIFPSQVGPVSLLWETARGWHVRFNELELQRAQELRSVEALPANATRAITELRELAHKHVRQHDLMRGECLTLYNYTTLHGRTAFPPGSGRLLKRIRVK